MNVLGQVISIDYDVQISKNGGGFYPGSRLTYRDSEGSIKEKAFHANVFKFNKALKLQLQDLGPNDSFVMTMEKEGDFWNVMNISKGDGVSSVTLPSQGASSPKTATPYKSPKSTYETPEERKIKQRYIVRQSSITAALSFLNNKAKKTNEVLKVAKEFEEYVFSKEPLKIEDLQGDEDEVFN